MHPILKDPCMSLTNATISFTIFQQNQVQQQASSLPEGTVDIICSKSKH